MKLKKTIVTILFVCLFNMPLSALSDVTVNSSATAPGSVATLTFSFTIPSGVLWPVTGGFDITFPAGFSIASVGAADVNPLLGIDGGLTVRTIVGQKLFTDRNGGGTAISDTPCKFTVKNVVIPSALGLTGTFLIELIDADQFTVMDAEVAPGIIISESLELGGGRNTSKFCLLDNVTSQKMYYVWYLMTLVLVGGFVRRSYLVV